MSSSDLPMGWAVASIDDVASPSGGSTPSKSDPAFWTGGDIPWVSPKDMKVFHVRSSEDTVTEKALARLTKIPENSVLMVVRSGILSRTLPVATNTVPVTINQDMRAFVPDDGVDSRFLAWQLIAEERGILDKCSKDGTTVASIEGPALSAYPLKIAPASEQTRIVEKLEELLSDLDAGVAELKAAQRKLAQYRQSLLKAAVEGALTADWRVAHGTPQETGTDLLQRILTERRARWEQKQLAKFADKGKTPPKGWQAKYPEPVAPDLADLPPLPAGWVWASLDQCALDDAAITDGPFGSKLKSEHYQESGPRVIRLQNIGDGVFVDARAHISESHYEELTKHAVEEGDLTVAMLGEKLPRACIVPAGVAPAIVKADCARVRLESGCLHPILALAQLNSPPIRKLVLQFVKGIGRPRINLGHVRSIPIALPPLAEQAEIVATLIAQLDAIVEQEGNIDTAFKQAAAQRKNLLKTAFAGQLVPQDPNDEPASVLLARIRAAREQSPAARGRRRAGSSPAPATIPPGQRKRGRKARERA